MNVPVVVAAEGGRTPLPQPSSAFSRFARRQGWTVGVALLLVVMGVWWMSLLPSVGGFQLRTITTGAMPLAFLTMSQAIIIIAGGIDLSAGAKLVLANCLAAMWMEDQSTLVCFGLAIVVIAVIALVSAFTGWVITATGVPDIVITLAANFSIAGLALFLIGGPGGGVSRGFQYAVAGSLSNPVPSVLWVVGTLVVVWLPLRRSRIGLSMIATGSDRQAAYLSGVSVNSARIMSYAIGGALAACSGLATIAITGGGDPRVSIANNQTLNCIAAAVLGGVALTGGIGGLVGPTIAAVCLALIPAIMLGLRWDPSNAETARGTIIIAVVLVAGLLQARRKKA